MAEQDINLEEIKKQCIFCHIVAGRVASKKVFEDPKVTAVLDINPGNPGHVLLLPKEHYAIMPQIPDEEIGHLSMNSKAISASLLRAVKCHGTTIFIANGVAAGQRAQHFMMHIIPRMENDGLGIELQENKISSDKLIELKKQLLPSIKKALGSAVELLPQESNQEVIQKKEDKPEDKQPKQKKSDSPLDDIARLLGA